jgi:hypothetical protein
MVLNEPTIAQTVLVPDYGAQQLAFFNAGL